MQKHQTKLHNTSGFRRTPIALAIALSMAYVLPSHAQMNNTQQEAKNASQALPEVKVTGSGTQEMPSEGSDSYTIRKSKSATKVNMSMRETPQSASVVTRAQMDDFRLNSANDVLNSTTGVVVEKIETDRTYYTARGFDITSFQVDGMGVPFTSVNAIGDNNTAIYDRVEVIRGANGLAQGTGNPSATVNFVRKRPTDAFQASAGVSYGSWNTHRLDADISGPLTKEGNVRARFVAAEQAGDSYLDRYSTKKTVFYGIVEADITKSTMLTLGHSQQRNKSNGAMWGALPLFYTDGSPTHYDTSTSTAADWSYWNTTNKTTFAELSHRFNDAWQAKAVLTHKDIEGDSKLFYAYGTPDRITGLGLFSYPSSYNSSNRQDMADIQVSGKLALGGRKHDVVIGANVSRSKMAETSWYGTDIGTPLAYLSTWNGAYPEPAFNASTSGSNHTDRQSSLYAATRINLADNAKLIVGANATSVKSSGTSYGRDQYRSASDVTPYLGMIVDLSKNVSAYASYTEIFNPQYEIDINRQKLDPIQGTNYEVGLKSEWFDKKLNASLALFKTKQKNTAEFAGYLGADSYYRGVDTFSEGFEIDVAGKLTPRLEVSAGFTHLSIKDKDGNPARTYTPKNLFKISATYRVPAIEKLKVGANLIWRDDTYRDVSSPVITTIRQSAYALLNLMAKYDITDKISVTANLNNVTNKKYINSLYWEQGYYGAPINGSIALNWKY